MSAMSQLTPRLIALLVLLLLLAGLISYVFVSGFVLFHTHWYFFILFYFLQNYHHFDRSITQRGQQNVK